MKRLSYWIVDLTAALRELSQPSWGCLFWGDGGTHGEVWGHAPDLQTFAQGLKEDFDRWGVSDPYMIVGRAWKIRLAKWILWALKSELH